MASDIEADNILESLGDGRFKSVGEMARATGIEVARAESCLDLLLDAGRVQAERCGARRYYCLANSAADVDFSLKRRAVRLPPGEPQTFMFARTCYSHLAGDIAVHLFNVLQVNGWIMNSEDGFQLTRPGAAFFKQFGSVPDSLIKPGVPIKACVDFALRRRHLGGPLGKAFAVSLEARGWFRRYANHRAIEITNVGFDGFRTLIGFERGPV